MPTHYFYVDPGVKRTEKACFHSSHVLVAASYAEILLSHSKKIKTIKYLHFEHQIDYKR